MDEELGLAYIPVELPTGDYFGGYRAGNARSSERASSRSICRPESGNGIISWPHHGLWDMDIPCAPMLVDIPVNGKIVKARWHSPPSRLFFTSSIASPGSPFGLSWKSPLRRAMCPRNGLFAYSAIFYEAAPHTITEGISIDSLINFTP